MCKCHNINVLKTDEGTYYAKCPTCGKRTDHNYLTFDSAYSAFRKQY